MVVNAIIGANRRIKRTTTVDDIILSSAALIGVDNIVIRLHWKRAKNIEPSSRYHTSINLKHINNHAEDNISGGRGHDNRAYCNVERTDRAGQCRNTGELIIGFCNSSATVYCGVIFAFDVRRDEARNAQQSKPPR